MRTTLDIDDDILAVAKELAEAQKVSAGKALSELARKGLVGQPGSRTALKVVDGVPLLPRAGPRQVVTSKFVRKLMDELD